MAASTTSSWQRAQKAPFEAFGILYYPFFRNHADLPSALDDEDMAWAVTANTNLEGTGYTLSQPSIHTLAAYHHAMAQAARNSALLPLATAVEGAVNPLADLRRLVPDVTASPMYPDFPTQVMEISEAQFRYDQARHYASTYGAELVAGLLGLDVTVGEGWLPAREGTPKTKADETLVAPKVLHVLMTLEDLESVVTARLARATRMHDAEVETALLVFSSLDEEAGEKTYPAVAFHENMMELIRHAADRDSATLERVATGLAQHPGDLLKATRHLLEHEKANHLSTRQKKGLCRAFERFDTMAIARNIADASRKDRLMPNFLSVDRFGGPRLCEAVELVETGQVRSWLSELERLWAKAQQLRAPEREEVWRMLASTNPSGTDTMMRERFDAFYDDLYGEQQHQAEVVWPQLLAHYGQRPGVLLRSLGRLLKAGCPFELVAGEAFAHADAYSLPTLVRTLTIFSATDHTKVVRDRRANLKIEDDERKSVDPELQEKLCSVLESLVRKRMRGLKTPLKGKRVFLDVAGISLAGSVLMPNETGDTGTAWPPVGIAFDVPRDKTVRFFTFWDDRTNRVDVDLHFIGRMASGEPVHIGWNSSFRDSGLVTSGDITTSHNSVEYLDADMAKALEAGVTYVVQEQHIFHGAANWGDIETCYSGALLVGGKGTDVALYNPENLLFRDDLTGEGTSMHYAVINVPGHYVRIMRGASMPLDTVDFSLGAYLDVLFETQDVTLVATPEEADLCVCVGRSDDPQVISLFDEGFYLG